MQCLMANLYLSIQNNCICLSFTYSINPKEIGNESKLKAHRFIQDFSRLMYSSTLCLYNTLNKEI